MMKWGAGFIIFSGSQGHIDADRRTHVAAKPRQDAGTAFAIFSRWLMLPVVSFDPTRTKGVVLYDVERAGFRGVVRHDETAVYLNLQRFKTSCGSCAGGKTVGR
jgi:hypothetical protein